jgi:hypothetical protein
MANRAMCNVLYNRSYVQESYELDAMVEKMSPGFLAALENNNGIEVPRPDGSEYTVGSYEWCNSYASDELSDYDWDAACEKAYGSGHRGLAQRRVMEAKSTRYLKIEGPGIRDPTSENLTETYRQN